MGVLTASRAVLDYRGMSSDRRGAVFASEPGDEGASPRFGFEMRVEDWLDMNSPTQVTVFVVPGDALNAEGGDTWPIASPT